MTVVQHTGISTPTLDKAGKPHPALDTTYVVICWLTSTITALLLQMLFLIWALSTGVSG